MKIELLPEEINFLMRMKADREAATGKSYMLETIFHMAMIDAEIENYPYTCFRRENNNE